MRRGAGGSSTSRSCTSGTTSSCPILPGGDANGCRPFPKEHVGERFFARETLRAWAGVVLYAVAGAIGYLVTPTVALAIFVALPVFYGVTTHGLDGLRLRRRRQ